MTPLRTGAARIALLAEARSEWGLGLRVQPVGLTYRKKHLFRGRVVAAYGEPFAVLPFREAYERDEREAVAALTDVIRERLEALTLNYDRAEDAELVDVAERTWVRAKGLAGARERDRMADRLPRLQLFTEGLRQLRDSDPERLERLRRSVARYLRLMTLYGVTEGDVPESYTLGKVMAYVARQSFMLALVFPVAVLGALYWATPFLVTQRIAFSFRPELDQIATYKAGVGSVSFPVWLGATCALVWILSGTPAAVVAGVVAPLAGLAAVAWKEREATVREDVRVFLRSRRRSQSEDRLGEQRAALVAEIDAIVRDTQSVGASGTES